MKISQYLEQLEREEVPQQKIEELATNWRTAMLELSKVHPKADSELIDMVKQIGSQVGGAFGGRISIDPIVLKDPRELMTVLLHESAHIEGIYNDGLITLELQKVGIPGVAERAREDYPNELSNVEEVTKRIGKDNTIELYKAKRFDEMFRIFVLACDAENFPQEQAEQMFFEAFPELEFDKSEMD